MSIQLNYDEDFSEGLKRLMIKECNTALKEIKGADSAEKKHVAVHEARKAFKKIRACLRLVRDEVGYYDSQNKYFRDLGRKISDIRDATANLETLDQLKEQYDSHLYANSFDKLRKKLENYRKELVVEQFDKERRLESIHESLKEKVEKIPGWELKIDDFEDIRPSIERTYKRGLKGLEASRESGEVEDFHEWRKRVKYLRYQIDVLNRLWPNPMEVFEDELHEVTDLTGMLNDLKNLKKTLEEQKAFADFENRSLLLALMEKQEEYLKEHALLIGTKFYFDSPLNFCDRLNVYWETHQEEINSKELPNPEYMEYG